MVRLGDRHAAGFSRVGCVTDIRGDWAAALNALKSFRAR